MGLHHPSLITVCSRLHRTQRGANPSARLRASPLLHPQPLAPASGSSPTRTASRRGCPELTQPWHGAGHHQHRRVSSPPRDSVSSPIDGQILHSAGHVSPPKLRESLPCSIHYAKAGGVPGVGWGGQCFVPPTGTPLHCDLSLGLSPGPSHYSQAKCGPGKGGN